MPKLIFIFFDGVGIGKALPTNPFYAAKTDYLPFYESGCRLPDTDQTPVKAIDAQLGVKGMPMSATGQTALFTGVNVPAILNEHRDSYPDKLMRKIIKEKNIFSLLKKNNVNPRFINAFPGSTHLFTPEHIHIRDDGEFYFSPLFKAQYKRSISVTTCMMIANRMIPFGAADILSEKALYHDFSNQSLDVREPNLAKFTPEKAAEIIYNVSRNYDLLLYEYFQTDFYGHGFDFSECIDLVRQLNRLVKHLVSLLDKENDTLLITSDHGNLEDNTTQLHTGNPVPLVTWGYRSAELRDKIESLVEIKPAVIDFFMRPSPTSLFLG
jgi:2,3-bisphosphoglycerate-independent phosphoglycerate mutase